MQTLLLRWGAGKISSRQVHEWAEERYGTNKYVPENDLVNIILAELDMLDLNLRTAEDAPFFLRILEFNNTETEKACSLLDNYNKSINMKIRINLLRNDPLYSRFCVNKK